MKFTLSRIFHTLAEATPRADHLAATKSALEEIIRIYEHRQVREFK